MAGTPWLCGPRRGAATRCRFIVSPCVGQSSRGWQLRQRGEVSTFAILSHAAVPSGAGCAVARLAARVTNPHRSPTTPAHILPSPVTLRTSIAVSVIGPSFCADLHGGRTGFARGSAVLCSRQSAGRQSKERTPAIFPHSDVQRPRTASTHGGLAHPSCARRTNEPVPIRHAPHNYRRRIAEAA